MISLLVSSKTMVPNKEPFGLPHTTPEFLKQAEELNAVLVKKSAGELQKLMHISPKLAEETKEKIHAWSSNGGTPAWYTFVGDVYKGLKIKEFTKEDVEFAQVHMGTISGLYGITRPLDTIHPYRLELMYKLSGSDFKDLYEFWGDQIAKIIPRNDLSSEALAKGEPVINLSSEEYIKVLRPYLPKDQIITPWFMQMKNGKPTFQVVHAKIARGTMARWIAKNKADDPSLLKKFNYSGYKYSEKLSSPLKPVFVREEGYDFRKDY